MGIPLLQKLFVGSYVVRQRLTGRKRYPLVLMLEPLHACNLTCTGCGRIREYASTIKDKLTVDECLAGVTREAARAIGRLESVGTLEAGKACDLAIWDIERPAELVYRMGLNPLHARVWKGL